MGYLIGKEDRGYESWKGGGAGGGSWKRREMEGFHLSSLPDPLPSSSLSSPHLQVPFPTLPSSSSPLPSHSIQLLSPPFQVPSPNAPLQLPSFPAPIPSSYPPLQLPCHPLIQVPYPSARFPRSPLLTSPLLALLPFSSASLRSRYPPLPSSSPSL